MATWQLQTAKAKLSELLRAVRDEGPQTISVRGKEEYVVTRKETTSTSSSAVAGVEPKTLWDLFEPVRGLGDDLEKALQGVREERARFDRED